MGLSLVFVSGGGSPWFNFDWSFHWPAAAAAAAAAAVAARRRRRQWPVAAPRLALCACRAAGARARRARLSRPSRRGPRRDRCYGRQRQRLARPLRPPAAPPPPRLIQGVYSTNAMLGGGVRKHSPTMLYVGGGSKMLVVTKKISLRNLMYLDELVQTRTRNFFFMYKHTHKMGKTNLELLALTHYTVVRSSCNSVWCSEPINWEYLKSVQ